MRLKLLVSQKDREPFSQKHIGNKTQAVRLPRSLADSGIGEQGTTLIYKHHMEKINKAQTIKGNQAGTLHVWFPCYISVQGGGCQWKGSDARTLNAGGTSLTLRRCRRARRCLRSSAGTAERWSGWALARRRYIRRTGGRGSPAIFCIGRD